MKTILKLAEKYKWYDPIIDAPIPQDRKERRSLAGHMTGGTAVGGLLGAGLSVGLDLAHGRKIDGKRALATGSIGLASGGMAGHYIGGRHILKKRISEGKPMYSHQEEAAKLKALHDGDRRPGQLIVYKK